MLTNLMNFPKIVTIFEVFRDYRAENVNRNFDNL